MAIQDTDCEHEFEHTWRSPFVDTRGARLCRRCHRIEVAADYGWIDVDDYLQQRRNKPWAAELSMESGFTNPRKSQGSCNRRSS